MRFYKREMCGCTAFLLLEASKLLNGILGLDIKRRSRYHTVLLGLGMTFLVEGVLSKKAPLTEGVCKHFDRLLALFDL